MHIFVPKEMEAETRVAVTPDSVKKLIALGCSVTVEASAGEKSGFIDATYQEAGAHLSTSEQRQENLRQADVIVSVLPLALEDIACLQQKAWHISFLDTFRYVDALAAFQKQQTNVISLERIPRTSFAQKMDAVSSQSNLAGYVGVLKGIACLKKAVPMFVTAAGTLQPARVFVIGAGVAGLQAIATAKRLGARVEAFDTRPEVEEQVRSVGAKFVKIDLGETGTTQQGYAKSLTDEQLQRQRELLVTTCARADIVITTAKVFGRKAPIIINQAILDAMQPNSVVVDLAVEAGGNTEGLVPGSTTRTNKGVYILGEGYWERNVPMAASQLFANNVVAFLQHILDAGSAQIKQDESDSILSSCWIFKDGQNRLK